MRGKNRNPWLLLVLLLVGLVVGGIIGDIFKDSITWLAYSNSIGIDPVTLDLNVIKLTFGFTININLAIAIGIIAAIAVFERL